MIEPPDKLDEAKVIRWAWSGNKPFGVIPNLDSNESIEVFGLAICQYENSSEVYRFCCDKEWEVQQDSVYESVDEALSKLPAQFKLMVAKWETKQDASGT
ncbi:MAG TPA: hypothetical protein VGD65_07550 [Chryseosolibacter sp.]